MWKQFDFDASVGEAAFAGCISLEEIEFPRSIDVIDASAFEGCTSLRSIAIPDVVTQVGARAFMGCTGLTSIPQSVMSGWSYGVFEGCTGLTSVSFADSVTEIGNSVFKGCTGLVSVIIPDSVISIGRGTFKHCTGLASIEIPDSVVEIGRYAFSGCISLSSVRISNSILEIPDGLFDGCAALTQVVIPTGVTSIGEAAFQGCTALSAITIPDSVAEIGANAFKDCTSLQSVAIPDSVASIDATAFEGCACLDARADAGQKFGGVDLSRLDNSRALVAKIRNRDIDLESLYEVNETLPAFWNKIAGSLADSYFDRGELSGWMSGRGKTDYRQWLASTDWIKLLGFCVGRASGSVHFEMDYLPGRLHVSTWLASDIEAIQLLYDAGAKYGSGGGASLTDKDVETMMMYGQADVVREIFRREDVDASKVPITDWMLERMTRSGNGSALRWVFEMHPDTIERAKDSISKLFNDRCYDSALALIEQRDSFKSPSVDKYFVHFAKEDNVGAVKTLIEKGSITKANVLKVDGAVKDIRTEAADVVRNHVAGLRGQGAPMSGVARSGVSDQPLTADAVRALNERLERAVESGDSVAVAQLIDDGAAPDLLDDIITVAVRQGSREILEALLTAKAKPTSEALVEAARKNDAAAAELLLKRKVSIRGRVWLPGQWEAVPVLGHAIAAESVDVVKLMLDSGQEISREIATLALNITAQTGNLEIAEALFSKVGELYATKDALAFAAEYGHPDMAVFLASKGAQLSGPAKWDSDLRGCFFRKSGAVSEERRLGVALALEEKGFLTKADKNALFAHALLHGSLLFAEKLDELGAELTGVFRSGLRTDGREKEYSLISDYLEPGQDEKMVRFICEHLEDGEVVRIRGSWLKPSSPSKPETEFLAQILPYSDGDHCDNIIELMRILAAADQADALAAMEMWEVFTRKNLDEAIKVAVEGKATRAAAYLLDCKERLFGGGGGLNL